MDNVLLSFLVSFYCVLVFSLSLPWFFDFLPFFLYLLFVFVDFLVEVFSNG